MNSLKINFLGYEINSPVVIASGPVSDSLTRIRKWHEAGAGAIITKTICSEKPHSDEKKGKRKIIQLPGIGAINASTYSKKTIAEWQDIIRELMSEGANIIPNIYERTNDKLADTVVKIAETGCKAIELGISCPNDDDKREVNNSLIKEYIKVVKKEVGEKVKIIIKLTAGDDILSNVRTAVDAGVDAISLSDTLKAIKVDIHHKCLFFNGPAGYSGAGIKPIVLYNIYQVRKAGIKCPIIGIGGISNADDILEYLHLGVSATQICTSLMYNKEDHLKKINRDLYNWCKGNNTTLSKIVPLV